MTSGHAEVSDKLKAKAGLAVLIAGPLLAVAGVSMSVCLLVVMLAPVATLIGYEIHGHRHLTEALERFIRG